MARDYRRREQKPLSGRALLLGLVVAAAAGAALSRVPLRWLERAIMVLALLTAAVLAVAGVVLAIRALRK